MMEHQYKLYVNKNAQFRSEGTACRTNIFNNLELQLTIKSAGMSHAVSVFYGNLIIFRYVSRHGGQLWPPCHFLWARIRKQAKISKGFRFHGLRHTFASYLASSGELDLYTLQKLLNHQTPEMTQRYAHLLDEALRRGANVADRMISGNGSNPD
jgi:hypothetical protein